MVIYFLTKEPDACQLIADKFSNEKSIVKIKKIELNKKKIENVAWSIIVIQKKNQKYGIKK